jgi:hypothetical protein
MLGKVKPAVAEAASGTERRTGDALKEIFPTLFEGAREGVDAPHPVPETPPSGRG